MVAFSTDQALFCSLVNLPLLRQQVLGAPSKGQQQVCECCQQCKIHTLSLFHLHFTHIQLQNTNTSHPELVTPAIPEWLVLCFLKIILQLCYSAAVKMAKKEAIYYSSESSSRYKDSVSNTGDECHLKSCSTLHSNYTEFTMRYIWGLYCLCFKPFAPFGQDM